MKANSVILMVSVAATAVWAREPVDYVNASVGRVSHMLTPPSDSLLRL